MGLRGWHCDHYMNYFQSDMKFDLFKFIQINFASAMWYCHMTSPDNLLIISFVPCRTTNEFGVRLTARHLWSIALLVSSVVRSLTRTNILLSQHVLMPLLNPFYHHGLTSIPACINNHIQSKVWDEITCSFIYYNGSTIEVWESITYLAPHLLIDRLYLNVIRVYQW